MRRFTKARLARTDSNVDMTPMLDIVFIMLIFFIVTTSFVTEKGVPLLSINNHPTNAAVDHLPQIQVIIDEGNVIKINDRVISIDAVTVNVESLKAADQIFGVIVLASPKSDAKTLVSVVDAVRRAGITTVTAANLE